MLTAVFAETMKQVGVQTPPMAGQPNPPGQQSSYQTGQRSSGYWTGEHHRRHHTHHHWKGRS